MSQTEAPQPILEFISRWTSSGAAERANYQLFLSELCDVIGVPRPEPARADSAKNAYVFEHPVVFDDGFGKTSTGFIDLYRRGAFILEAKQGSDREPTEDETGLKTIKKARRGTAVRGTSGWDDAMIAALGQAKLYAQALPVADGWPPFLVIVDVGHSIELFADFTRSGKTYVAFPDARTHRVFLGDLADEAVRERLRMVWTDPLELDPSRKSAKVTREVASRLADLAKSFERSGHEPQRVAQFLMRCLFTMFAEDVGLLPKKGFTTLLEGRRGKLSTFPDMLGSLWNTMDKGGFSPQLETRLLRFNGQLFADSEALPVTETQLELLIDAAKADWQAVEPAIFGTLLERALDPVERHKLGAHYTPRAYVERLVLPTIVEPLREQWEAARAAAVTLAKGRKIKDARAEVLGFLDKLCSVTILDPACGTGNFLYVTLEHLKRIEGEARDVLQGFGRSQEVFEGLGRTVDPHQLLGIELNPRAAAIAELVLWIGYLQWHFRTFGERMPAEPVIKAFHNIECRDAVLAYDRAEPVLDDAGNPVTRWDGRTTKKHPVTGEDVPDDSARTPVLRYVNPRKAEWPKADYIVGNPPFIGNPHMRNILGDGYVDAVRRCYENVPDTSDYVMYWWAKAAGFVQNAAVSRFGLITTKALKQSFNRKVVQTFLSSHKPLSIVFAIQNHPWIDSGDGAAVRISMTVAENGEKSGRLHIAVAELPGNDGYPEVVLTESTGRILADLRVGPDVAQSQVLMSNHGLSNTGVKLHGKGFLVSTTEAQSLGLGKVPGLESYIRHYRNGRDINQISRNLMVIDLDGLSITDVAGRFPQVYQWILERVKPEREHNKEPYRRENWWLFGRRNTELRSALRGLRQYIVTVETSKHRTFTFLTTDVLPDNKLIAIGMEDAFPLGVLSSRVHVRWACTVGGNLGEGNDPVYVKTACFEKFPFPAADETSIARIRDLGQLLDSHRKRRLAANSSLTLTGMYNVLEKLRSGEPLSDKDKVIHEQGLVSVLKQIHDDLDAAVFEAYGWPSTLTDDEILTRLVELNAERAAEEARGIVRWLRPEFQNPGGRAAESQGTLIEEVKDDEPRAATIAPKGKTPWPKTMAEQAQAIRAALSAHRGPVTAETLAKSFTRARVDRIEELLATLVTFGHAREVEDGLFVPPTITR